MNSMNFSSGEELEVTPIAMWLGLQKDYYIALGIKYKGYYEFPFKKFYWTTSANFTFEPLPERIDQYKKEANEKDGLFLGDPDKILIEAKPGEPTEAPPAEPEAPPEPKEEEKKEGEQNPNPAAPENPVPEAPVEEAKPQVVPKNFTELERLSYVIRAIENDTHVIPEGAYKLIPQHEIRRNIAFRGLDRKDLGKLSKYYHFRNVQMQEKKTLVESTESVFRYDIFDPLMNDKPNGAWSVQVDPSETIGTVKSLLWPGYVSYSVSGTNQFGGAYFGDGMKNKDLTFML